MPKSTQKTPENALPLPETQASIHRRTRCARSEERSQDYVEVIADLIDHGGEARAIDVARRMGVNHVTAGRIIARMQRDGLVTTQPYRSIFLTPAGRAMAEVVRVRHQTVVEFLTALGVDEETAACDAEGIEHHVSEATLAAFRKFIDAQHPKRKR